MPEPTQTTTPEEEARQREFETAVQESLERRRRGAIDTLLDGEGEREGTGEEWTYLPDHVREIVDTVFDGAGIDLLVRRDAVRVREEHEGVGGRAVVERLTAERDDVAAALARVRVRLDQIARAPVVKHCPMMARDALAALDAEWPPADA